MRCKKDFPGKIFSELTCTWSVVVIMAIMPRPDAQPACSTYIHMAWKCQRMNLETNSWRSRRRKERTRERILYHWSMRRDYPENMSTTSVVHWIPCRLRESPPARDFPLILSEQSDVSNGRGRISSLPKLCKRKSLPISYGKLRMELFVKFNSRSFTKSPRYERRPLNFSVLLSLLERFAGAFFRGLDSLVTRAYGSFSKSTRVWLIKPHSSNTHSLDRLFFHYCAVNICNSSSGTYRFPTVNFSIYSEINQARLDSLDMRFPTVIEISSYHSNRARWVATTSTA